MTKFYVDDSGIYLGGFDGATPPNGSIEVDSPPISGLMIFKDGAFEMPVDLAKETAKAMAKKYSIGIIENGILWRSGSSDSYDDFSLDSSDRELLREFRQNLKELETSPHGGFVWSGGKKITIDDDGLEELCEFVSKWILSIGRLLVVQFEAIDAMDSQDAMDYDPAQVSWDVTWSQDQIDLGWSGNTLTQTP